MAEIALIVSATSLAVLVWLALGFARLRSSLKDPVAAVAPLLEAKHRAMLTDLHIGLTQQGDRLGRHLTDSSERLSAKIDQRLDQIAGKVDERLDEGFKKTNETFVNVMQRLATIDEAQKQFKADIRKHVDDIARKYIIAGETSDGAVMFVPAEAVFAEIHAYHPEVVEYAIGRRVWIVSPTTLMAVLNTARAVLKDVETRRHIHIIQEELGKLGVDFQRFDERMKKLADHIRQAHQDAEDVQVSSRKISQRFQQIEAAEIEEKPSANVVRLEQHRK